jgi:hypothetical protein
LGEFLHCGNQKKSHANFTKVFLGFFSQVLPYLQGNCKKLPCLDIAFIKAIKTKQDFEKKCTTHLG